MSIGSTEMREIGSLARRLRSRAFTLVELLVVLGIVVILVAITLPVVSKIKGSAARISCISKLKNLWKDWDVYSRDNRGILYKGGNTWVIEMYMAGALTSADETKCPATHINSTDAYFYPTPFYGSIKVWSGPPAQPLGYAVNNLVFYSSGNVRSAWNFKKLSTTPLFVDGLAYGITAAVWQDLGFLRKRISFRHQGRANFVFLDGHVESLSSDDLALVDPEPF